MSNRRTAGMTLMEMSAVIALSGTLLGGTFGVLSRLQRLAGADTARGTRAELACDQVRRDLATGPVTVIPGGMQIGALPWRVIDGQLLRGERQMLGVSRFDLTTASGRQTVTIVPVGLPARHIEVIR